MIAASSLTAGSGVSLAALGDPAVLALVAFIGTINPFAGSVGLFIPPERAPLAGRVADAARTHNFARHP